MGWVGIHILTYMGCVWDSETDIHGVGGDSDTDIHVMGGDS